MGYGSWTTDDFKSYSTSRGFKTSDVGVKLCKNMSADQVYVQKRLAKELDPFEVVRECRDSEDHPETLPVILALDVTGSMGKTAVEISAEINTIMTELYKTTKDIQFMIMGIGDLMYDTAPLQVSQFEADVRIAEQLDKIYFEFGGGPNRWESYSAAWAFGADQTDLDCWKRGKRGIIITMGDEELNPTLSCDLYEKITGQKCEEGSLDTDKLYKRVIEKYDIYHINVDHRDYYKPNLDRWNDVLGKDHVITAKVEEVPQIISAIVTKHAENGEFFRSGEASTDDSPTVASIGFTENISW